MPAAGAHAQVRPLRQRLHLSALTPLARRSVEDDISMSSHGSDETGDTPKSVLATTKKRGSSFAGGAQGKRSRSAAPPAPALKPAATPLARQGSLRFADRHSVVSLPAYFGVPADDFSDFPSPQPAGAAAGTLRLSMNELPRVATAPQSVQGRELASFPPERDFEALNMCVLFACAASCPSAD